MKKTQLALVAGLVASGIGAHAAVTALPSSAALPIGSSTTRGMLVRSVQGPADPRLANSLVRATKQLNGTLTDSSGVLVPNEANAGPNSDGSYTVDLAHFEKDAQDFTIVDVSNNPIWSFG